MPETAALVPTGNRPFGQEEKFALAISGSEIREHESRKKELFPSLLLCQILPGFVRCGSGEGEGGRLQLLPSRRSIDLISFSARSIEQERKAAV